MKMPCVWNVVLCAILFASGCTTKTKARAEAKAAYAAGQRDAMTRWQAQQSGNITFVGPVQTPIIPWSEDLTLSKALVQARYTSRKDPSMILIQRKEEKIPVDPQKLLEGEDVPVQPGDIIALVP